MVRTAVIVAASSLLVLMVGAGSFLYPTLNRPQRGLIVSVDAMINGETDDLNREYRSYSRPKGGLLNETFVVRIANLGSSTSDLIDIILDHEPKTTSWFSFLSAEKSFGEAIADLDSEIVRVSNLRVGETVSIRFHLSMNMTLIEVNNALQDKSQLIFTVDFRDALPPEIMTYTVRLPPR